MYVVENLKISKVLQLIIIKIFSFRLSLQLAKHSILWQKNMLRITPKVCIALSQCPRKAYLLLFPEILGNPNDYQLILKKRRKTNRLSYLKTFKKQHQDARKFDNNSWRKSKLIIGAHLKTKFCEAYCDVLIGNDKTQLHQKFIYEPTIIVGTYKTTKEQKIEILFIGKILGEAQNKLPSSGVIIQMSGKQHRVKLANEYKLITKYLKILKNWINEKPSEPPKLILNKHCQYCQFKDLCHSQAIKDNDISLLDRITPREIKKYNSRGIFTIQQLSFLFKPRKYKSLKYSIRHKFELQALAIREQKIYIQELPQINRNSIEFFLDIEGVPDQDLYYLIGLSVSDTQTKQHYSFWANNKNEEKKIWSQLVEKLDEYPEAPIYHYGSYEPRAINTLSKRYSLNSINIENRLINIISYVYGKIYCPVFSNSLKDICKYIGFSWTLPNSSGIQSLAWRFFWEDTREDYYKSALVTYNQEDCMALMSLTRKISEITSIASSDSQIDFADSPKKHATPDEEKIHKQFENILRFAHTSYDQKKIKIRLDEVEDLTSKNKRTKCKKRHRTYRKIIPKAEKRVEVPRMLTCPKHFSPLRETRGIAGKTIIDLNFENNGVNKTITRYFGRKSHCKQCNRYYSPPEIRKYPGPQLYGRGFHIWVSYQRVALKLPHRTIVQAIEDQFDENINSSTIRAFVHYLAQDYADTERLLIQSLINSPILHVDETPVNIERSNWYAWVFTDRKNVVFKLTKSREVASVKDILSNYRGILISDFYSGYDSLSCRHQKCWVHLIRDLNEDLWKNPYDVEFESFVLNIKNLILPIFESVRKYGLKKSKLQKYKVKVEIFYDLYITNIVYTSDLVNRYKKRFERYRESLFTFLDKDGVSWHNNYAENAIRHFAKQRDASGYMFESSASDYLLLLGIKQTCRFQNKSFLKFLLSGVKDVNRFKPPARRKNTVPVGLE